MHWPKGHKLKIKSFGKDSVNCLLNVRAVSLLGSKAKLKWKRTAAGLAVELPAGKAGDFPFVLKVS